MICRSKIVNIGDVPLGGNYPVRVQTMTNTNTLDTKASVEQILRIIRAGSDYVRLTARNNQEAENLKEIKNELRKIGYNIPLIADIHFNNKIAETAARIVEKVRINPGNYSDKKLTGKSHYSEVEYKDELLKIGKKFIPLLKICKEYGTAIRIGVNHGSLSDRIMDRYGDTPEGMVESAMEYLGICIENDFENVVLSMKSSNAKIMIMACRLLYLKMSEKGIIFPQHLGVTEAGEGLDGRIKSSIGIGSLLLDGIGDTIRVSLTEEPELEIPFAKKIVEYYKVSRNNTDNEFFKDLKINKRESLRISNIGGNGLPVIIHDLSQKTEISKTDLNLIKPEKGNGFEKKDLLSDFIYAGNRKIGKGLIGKAYFIVNSWKWQENYINQSNIFPFFTLTKYLEAGKNPGFTNFLILETKEIEYLKKLDDSEDLVLILKLKQNKVKEQRRFFEELEKNGLNFPVILFKENPEKGKEESILCFTGETGSLFMEGFGDGIWLKNKNYSGVGRQKEISLQILQACRLRSENTEFISCPSCGRTLFDIQKTVKLVKKKLGNLKGLKIAIMGCIVNGPGEMADADYGYIGGSGGKVSLYMKKTLVKQNVPEEYAVDELLKLIKETRTK